MRCSVLFLLVGTCGVIPRADALDPERTIYQYNCRSWQRTNGMPSSSVRAIAQAADGALWLGTSRGLVLFDGIEFRSVGLPGHEQFTTPVVTALTRRSAGGLWVGLERGGFGYFDGERFHPLRAPELGEASATVRVVHEARDGTLLVGTTAAFGRWTATGQIEVIAPDADVMSVFEEDTGRVWLGTADDGVLMYANRELKPFTAPGQDAFADRVISALAVDQERNVWIGSSNGLFRFHPSYDRAPEMAPATQPQAMLVDRHGVLWVASMSGGLIRIKDGQLTSLRKIDGLASERVLSLAESDDGSLWVGTEDGLSQLIDVKFPIVGEQDGLAAEVCLSVAAAPGGGIWAGTSNGLSRINEGTITNFGIEKADNFVSRWNKRVFAARNGDVYLVSGPKRLSRFRNGAVDKVWAPDEWPRAMAEDSRGLIVAIGDTLMRLENEELVPYPLVDGSDPIGAWINELMVARDDTLWVAGENGIGHVVSDTYRDLTRNPALADRNFIFLCEDDTGAVWAARNSGLVRFRGANWTAVGRAQGLRTDFIHAMICDRLGDMWLDCTEGILRVDQKELNAVADGAADRLLCDVFDGVYALKTTDKVGQEYSAARAEDGRIYFPSARGVIVIDPTRVSSNLVPPRVRLRRVIVNGREVSIGIAPAIDPGPANLEFNFGAYEYQGPERVRYRYRLRGLGDSWTETESRRSAFFTHLPPGEYRFEVLACNADGVWSTEAAAMEFTVPERFHETGWFRGVLAVLVLGAVAIGFRMRERSRRGALEEIRRREELQRAMIDSSPVAMVMLENGHRVVHANRTFTRLFGYTAADAPTLDQWWPLAFPDPEYRAERIAQWKRRLKAATLAGAPVEPAESVVRCKDGSTRIVQTTSSAVGERTLIVLADITEQKRADEAVRELNATLERRVHDRTAELESSNRELESFSYSVSHDLRAPLRGIDGFSHLLMKHHAPSLEPTARGYLERIRSECQRMGSLIDGLLQLSRMTRTELNPVSIDLSEAARQCARRVAEGHPQVQVAFRCTDGLHCRGDARLIDAALFNLIDNAWKFSGKSTRPCVEVGRVSTSDGPAFYVRDNGAGFDMKYSGKLFGVFQRLHAQSDFPGTGIGLATVHRIIHRHGGRIWAESEPGVQTTLYFTLPES